VLRTREHAPIPYPFIIFTFGFTIESTKEFGGVLTMAKRRKEEVGIFFHGIQ
jgi:hypothetical protein